MSSDDNILAGLEGFFQGISGTAVPIIQSTIRTKQLGELQRLNDERDLANKIKFLPYEEASKIRQKRSELAVEQPYKLEQIRASKEQPSFVLDEQGNLISSYQGKVAFLPQKQTEEEKLTARLQAKLDREKPHALGSLQNTLREYDNMINEADAISNDPNLSYATGISSVLGKVPGTGAKKVAARVETLKAKTLLNVLSSLKQLSATGASGFGQLSDIEGQNIKNSVSTLDTGLAPQDFKDSLKRFVAEMRARKQNLKRTFENTYGEKVSDGIDFTPE